MSKTTMTWDSHEAAKKMADETVKILRRRQMDEVMFEPRHSFLERGDESGKVLQHIWISEEKNDIYFNIFHEPISERPSDEKLKLPDYWFEYSRCNTSEKLVGWIRQLTGKVWCTRGLIDELIEKSERVHIYKTGKVLFNGLESAEGFKKGKIDE